MGIKTIVFLLFGLAFVSLTEAQQQPKIFKIGYLSAVPDRQRGASESVRRELETLGYVEGKNITFESRYADNKLDRLPGLANELVRLNVDLSLPVRTLPPSRPR